MGRIGRRGTWPVHCTRELAEMPSRLELGTEGNPPLTARCPLPLPFVQSLTSRINGSMILVLRSIESTMVRCSPPPGLLAITGGCGGVRAD